MRSEGTSCVAAADVSADVSADVGSAVAVAEEAGGGTQTVCAVPDSAVYMCAVPLAAVEGKGARAAMGTAGGGGVELPNAAVLVVEDEKEEKEEDDDGGDADDDEDEDDDDADKDADEHNEADVIAMGTRFGALAVQCGVDLRERMGRGERPQSGSGTTAGPVAARWGPATGCGLRSVTDTGACTKRHI